ncbi:DedA family protein [Candidatus Pacearchaeota archaeon]|nr:DedA family protein [Candidatus Pacearchaeota archaeon]
MAIADFLLHLDKYIGEIIQTYGVSTYLILFLIIFTETGLVIAPFLPGDSLIFIIGTFAGKGYLNVLLLFVILAGAAIIGDSVNYWIGSYFGKRFFSNSKLIKREHLQKTENFYKKYGVKTIIIARFMPILRTIAPFVAGVGKMDYKKFFIYNITGGVIWVGVFLFSGYLFGEIPFVQDNLMLIVIVIILISVIPPILEYLNKKKITT